MHESMMRLTLTPAMFWGFTDRGLVRQGAIADLNIFDPATIAPQMPTIENDLPTGAQRLKQKSAGIMATIIGGKVAFRAGEHTGSLKGKLLRSTAGGVQ